MMGLPFLDKEGAEELVLRVRRASATEHKRHRESCAAVTADHAKRGLAHPTLSQVLIDEEIDHRRRLVAIMREELFAIIEAKNTRLSDSDVKAITEHLKNFLQAHAEQLKTRLAVEEQRQFGKSVGLRDGLKQKIEEVMHVETIAEVRVRAAALRRKQKSEQKKWWQERIEKLVWLVVGGFLGIVGTLLVQWALKRLG